MVSTLYQLISYLEKLQNSDGSFDSLSSPNPSFAGKNYSYTTICSTAYIAYVLSLVTDSEEAQLIQKKAVEFLIKNKSPSQTWNYWSKDSPEYEKLPYPDDADDTFASLIALHSYDPDSISGKSLATIVNGLTAIEKTVGGPYYTWYTSSEDPVWKDIDCVANSQIAHFLNLYAIELPKLTRYFDIYIRSGAIMSQYYPSPLQCMYFIARWYRGKCKKLLSDSMSEYMESKEELTPLELALGISSLSRLGENSPKLNELFQSKLDDIDLWNKPYPWCIDPTRNKKHYFSGSSAITLAAAIEACVLLGVNTVPKGTPPEKPEEKYFKQARIDCLDKVIELPERLQKGAKERILLALDTTAGKYCITSPCIFILACNLLNKAKSAVVRKICYAQACGWIAYEIFDDVVDENSGANIGVGLHFYADMLNSFNELLVGSPYLADINSSIIQMNTALFEDAEYMKTPNNQAEHFSKSRVLQKSAGYILGLLCALHHLGFDRNSETTHALLAYQQNIILALQLSDDAHDWQEDIDRHQRNSVVDMLPKLIQLTPDKREEYFWKRGVHDVLMEIQNFCDQAEALHSSLDIVQNPEILQTPINKIRKMCRKTIQDRDTALEFLKMYSE